MFCPYCGEENLEGSIHCKKCQKELVDRTQKVEKKEEEIKPVVPIETNASFNSNPSNKKQISLFVGIDIILGLVCFYLFLVITGFFCDVLQTQWKPIIYIYPEVETQVEVKVNHPEDFTVTYPKYQDGWKVIARPDGTLLDSNGREYYSLYWESQTKKKNPIKEDGFIVEGKDTVTFLEEKLEILGLNEKEANEFIIYWLPILENNPYNYIRFQTKEEMDQDMTLRITPEPDTLIRVRMEFKNLNKPIKVKEQILERVERSGYTVVEWGATNIN